jgi:hypothetical protein
MLSKETMDGIKKRLKSVNPTWMLVGGPNLEHLGPYREKLAMGIFVDIFYKQLNGDGNRRKDDLIQIAYDVAKYMKLNPTRDLAEKFIDSLMWSEGKNFARFSFMTKTFNEEIQDWEDHRYQYFTLDRESSDLNNQIEVFKLTEESEEVVIKSQEIMEEYDLTVQTVISVLLIKRGRFRQALNVLQILDVKVKRLIQKEEEHRRQIFKDPKGAIYLDYKKWGENLEEVRIQFQEEMARYDEMERILKFGFEREPDNPDITKLFYRIRITKREHDKLSRLVIGNIQKEFSFRTDETLFTKLWIPPKTTFRNTVMEEQVIPKGLCDPNDSFKIINILFSPQKKFIYPIQWMIKEHGNRDKPEEFDTSNESSDNDEGFMKLDIKWDEIVDLWTPIFIELMNKGEISNIYLLNLSESQIQRWIECREAMDMWVLFLMRDQELSIPEKIPKNSNDQKIKLLGKVIENNIQLKGMLGKAIEVKPLNKTSILIDGKVEMVPIRIALN